MKLKKIAAMGMALAMTFALTACGSSDSSTGDSSSGSSDNKVAVFYYAYSDTYISSVRTALDAALDEAGVTYQDFDSNNTQTTQNEQVDTALSDGYNILVVNLVSSGSSDAASTIIEKAEAKGAKVIFFNRAVEEEGNEGAVLNEHEDICFVGTDAPEAGHLQGQMIGEYLVENFDAVDLNGDGVISYAMMKGDEANVEAIYRTQYSVEDANAVLSAAGLAELVYFDANSSTGYQVDMGGAWSASAANEYMTTNLSQYNEANGNMIELVICNNDNMAEGTISALEVAGYNTGSGKTIPVFGVDATASAQSLIAEGKMTGTVKQDADGMAEAICQMVENVSAGTSMADGISAVAASGDIFTVADGISNKLYVAYAAYTG
jgi:methyl-galactoside transport system substrate-binding protein